MAETYVSSYASGAAVDAALDKAMSALQGGSGDNKLVIEDSFLKLQGTATVWQDLDFPIVIRATGTGIPSLQPLIGNITAPQWQVGDYNVCEGQELVHLWKEGSRIYWHCHLITNGVEETDTFVKFEVEAAVAKFSSPLAALTKITSAEIKIPANTPDKTHLLVVIGTSDLTGYTIGSQLYARLQRIAATGAAPANDPWVTMLQAHLEIDSLGSREIASK